MINASNILDLFTAKRQSDGGGDTTATLDGIGEDDGSDNNSVSSFFNTLSDTYSTVKGALDSKSATPNKVAAQSPTAASGFNWKTWTPFIIGGVVLLVIVIVVLRK